MEGRARARRLAAAGARRVLDVGCGTGRHVAALLERGHEAFGSDASSSMIERARVLIGDASRFEEWRLEEPVPPALAGRAPGTPGHLHEQLRRALGDLPLEGAVQAAQLRERVQARDGEAEDRGRRAQGGLRVRRQVGADGPDDGPQPLGVVLGGDHRDPHAPGGGDRSAPEALPAKQRPSDTDFV